MKIPKSILINDQKWVIKYKWNLSYKRAKCHGLCDYDNRTIFIDRGSLKEERPHIFLHELFHACLHEYGIELGGDIEEAIADDYNQFLLEKFTIRLKRN